MSDTKILQMILDKLSNLEKKVDRGFKTLSRRMDNLGLQLANLEDDSPTIDEFDELEKRVSKIEKQIAS